MPLLLIRKPTLTTRDILRCTTALLSAHALALTPALSYALPTGGVVNGGAATITNNTNTMNVNQASNKAIIDWSTFNIGGSESVIFQQPNASAIALNRIHDSNPSQILGTLSANGQVWLLNPNGVMFGQNAQVNVAGLVVSTANISNDNFMASIFIFDRPGRPDALITNAGTITVAQAGLVAFVAPSVVNSGTIMARLGRVQFASGDTFTLDLYGDGLINLAASPAIVRQLVRNSGVIKADGGHVTLTAAAASNVADELINMDGIIQANAIGQQNGQVVLYAVRPTNGEPSTTLVSGTISATGLNSGETGGTVEVLGDHVGLLSGANINVSGDAGGGTVRIGGDFHGSGVTPTAEATIMQQGANIGADAITYGDGGNVAVWADDYTRFAGSISARGGALSGNGGVVETSGKQVLDMFGSVNASAPHGNNGTWLMDPDDLVVNNLADNNSGASPNWVAGGGGGNVLNTNINTALDAGTDVTLTASGSITINSDITQSASPVDNALSLYADGNIIVNASITSNSHKLNMLFNADRDGDGSGYIAISPVGTTSIASNGGNITMGGGSGPISAGVGYAVGNAGQASGVYIYQADVVAGGGNVVINGKGYNTTTDNNYGIFVGLNSGAGSVTTTGNGTIALTGLGGGASNNSGLNYGVDIGVSTTVSTANGDLTITGTGGGHGSGSLNFGVLTDANGVTKTTGSGTVNITGTGGNGGGSGDFNYGVYVNSPGGVQTTGGGAIIVTGTGGDSSGVQATGVNVSNGNSIVGSGAAITVVGDGGNGAGTGNYGLLIGGNISNSGTGTISLTGHGHGTSGTGIYISDADINGSISAVNGDITLNGTAGGTDGFAYGVGLDGSVRSTGSGNIILTGQGSMQGVTSQQNTGVHIVAIDALRSDGTGNITVTGTGGTGSGGNNFGIDMNDGGHGAASITSTGSGNITLTAIAGDSSAGKDFFTFGIIPYTIGGASDTGNITIISDGITWSGATPIQTARNITVKQHTNGKTIGLGAGAGDLSLNDTELGYFNWGTAAAGKSLTIGDTDAGDITIDTASTILNKNVNVITGSNITLQNTALAHAGGAAATLGMYADGNITTSSAITAGGSKLNVYFDADHDDSHSGFINIGSAITSNGGNITMGGGSGAITAGGGYAYGNAGQAIGVYVNNVGVAAGGGNIVINGRGFNATTDSNYGVRVLGNNGISTTGTGTINVHGIGGGGLADSASNAGIIGGAYSTASGNITLTGTGGGAGAGSWNVGIQDFSATTTGGHISVTGTGGTGSGGNNDGVDTFSPITLSTTGTGNITVTGTAGESSYGVMIADDATYSTVNGAISVDAITGGITLANDANLTSTGSGNITLNGRVAGISTNNNGANIIGGASANGNITLIGDAMALTSAGSNYQTTGNITVHQYTNGTAIGVGAGAGALSLDDTELSYFHWGVGQTLTIGDVNAGAMTINTAYTFPGPVAFNTNGANITVNSNITATNSNMTFNDAVVLGANSTLDSGSGTITFGSTVNGAHDLKVDAGTISLNGNIGGSTPLAAVSLNSTNGITLPSISSSSIFARTTGGAADITIGVGKALTASGAGNAIVLASGRNLVNNSGAGALSTPAGNWVIFSNSNANDTPSGLNQDTIIYSQTYPDFTGVSGNTWIFRTADSGAGFVSSGSPSISAPLSWLTVAQNSNPCTMVASTNKSVRHSFRRFFSSTNANCAENGNQ